MSIQAGEWGVTKEKNKEEKRVRCVRITEEQYRLIKSEDPTGKENFSNGFSMIFNKYYENKQRNISK